MKKLLLFLLLVPWHITITKTRPTYIFAHGLADTLKQARNYVGVLFERGDTVVTFDFPDATRQFWRVNFAESALGQKDDIDRLASIVIDRLELNPREKFIGIGVSRGGATWLSFMGIHGSDAVKALVVESPPDSMASAAGEFHGFLPIAFWKYDPKGIQPREYLHNIPRNLPILIICTKDDYRVPYSSTVEIYKILRETGHNKVHILVFESGNHAKFVLGDHRSTYRNVAHAFYKKYGFPYDKKAARAGKKLFSLTQPNPEDLL